MTRVGTILKDSLTEDAFRYIPRQAFLLTIIKWLIQDLIPKNFENISILRSLSKLFQRANCLSDRVNYDVKKRLGLIPQGH